MKCGGDYRVCITLYVDKADSGLIGPLPSGGYLKYQWVQDFCFDKRFLEASELKARLYWLHF